MLSSAYLSEVRGGVSLDANRHLIRATVAVVDRTEFYGSVTIEVVGMTGVKHRLPMLYEIRGTNRQVLRENFNDPNKDREGTSSASLISDLRFFGVAEFVLRRDVATFRSHLKEAAEIRERVFSRIDEGEPIHNSYDSILGYQDVLNALAAGDFDTAESLANRVLRTAVRSDVHDFDEALGRALCSIVARARNPESSVDAFRALCSSKEKDFGGYAEFFSAVLQKNADAANKSLANVISGHKRQSRAKGVFENTEDEALCVWAIAVANLAAHRGIRVLSPDEELVPSDLLVRFSRRPTDDELQP